MVKKIIELFSKLGIREQPLQIRERVLGFYFARPSLVGFHLAGDGTWKGSALWEGSNQAMPVNGTWYLSFPS